jgi:hypothetical protein
MGLLNGFFKRKKLNLFEVIAYKFENEEKKKVMLNSPLLNNRQLILNHDNIFSFVIAVFYFELNFNPIFQNVQLKKDYSEILEKEKNHKTFQSLYNSMLEFNNPNPPNLNRVVYNFVYTYLETVWGIKEKIPDPVLLTNYGVYLTRVRGIIKDEIIESLPLLVDK